MAHYAYKFIGGPMEQNQVRFPMPIEEAPEHQHFAFKADGSPYTGQGQPASAAIYHKEFRDNEWVYVYDPGQSQSGEEFFSGLKNAEFISTLNEYTTDQLINNLVHRPQGEHIVIAAKGNNVRLGLNREMPRHRVIALLKGALRAVQG